jgi:hypothetical protein
MELMASTPPQVSEDQLRPRRAAGARRAASLEAVAALLLGLVGAAIVRRRRLLSTLSTTRANDVTQAVPPAVLLHPVVAALVLGNLAIVAISVVQLVG